MRIAIVYDSVFGNTAEIAKAIASAAAELGEVTLVPVREAQSLDPATFDLLLVGSPTR
jgi:menaquinone-dependent protoporphyrinogen IX oxidase